MNKFEKKFLQNTINKYSKKKTDTNKYPLSPFPFEPEDILKGAETLLRGKITMSDITAKFENEFANFLGVKHALMVNSGSSANLLAFFALINPENKKKLKATMNVFCQHFVGQHLYGQ